MKAQLSAWLLRLPLPHELVLGGVRTGTREYVVCRLRTPDSPPTWAVGYTRSTDLMRNLRVLASTLPTVEGDDPAAIQTTLARRFANAWTDYSRAASLLDICLWQSYWARSSSARTRSKGEERSISVVGYFPQRGQTALIDEAVAAAASGADLKLMMSNSPASDLSMIDALRGEVSTDTRIAVDAHGLFSAVEDAVDFSAELEARDIDFFEDPFPGRPLRKIRALREQTMVPIAVGEDLTDLGLLDGLAETSDILRFDATVAGGFTTALQLVEIRRLDALDVFPHVFARTHAILADLGLPLFALEQIPASSGADPIDSLVIDHEAKGSLAFDSRRLDACAAETWTLSLDGKEAS